MCAANNKSTCLELYHTLAFVKICYLSWKFSFLFKPLSHVEFGKSNEVQREDRDGLRFFSFHVSDYPEGSEIVTEKKGPIFAVVRCSQFRQKNYFLQFGPFSADMRFWGLEMNGKLDEHVLPPNRRSAYSLINCKRKSLTRMGAPYQFLAKCFFICFWLFFFFFSLFEGRIASV